MFETNDRDDVGAAFDRAWATDLPIPNGLGRHDNDGMFSFYVQTPGRLPGRGRPRRPRRHRRLGRQPPLRPHQRVGPPAAALRRERRRRRRRRRRDRRLRPGRASRSRSCSPSSGAPVVVLERWPEPYPLPRAVHFDHEVGRILQSCGIGDELRPISEPAEVYEWRNARGHDAAALRPRRRRRRRGWPASSMFNQPELEALLDGAGRDAADVDVRRGVEVDGARAARRRRRRRPRADGTTVRGPLRRRLRRRQQHRARRCSASPSHDLGFFYDWLIVDVILDEPRVFDPINLQICDPARPTTAVSGGPGRRRWEFMRLPARVARRAQRRGARRGSCSRRGTCTPATPGSNATPSTRSSARYAEQWRDGRVLPRRRRRPPDAAVRRPGHVLRAPRRRQPRVEARPRARRARAPTRCSTPTSEERLPSARAAIELLDGARQGHLRARPGRGRGARRGDGRRRRRRAGAGARPARHRRRASSTRPRRTPGTQFVQGTRRRPAVRRRARHRLAPRRPSTPTPTASIATSARGSRRSAAASSPLADPDADVRRAGSPSTTRRARCSDPTSTSTAPRRRAARRHGAARRPPPPPRTRGASDMKLANHRRPRRARPRRRDRRRRTTRPAAASAPTR